MDSEPLPAQEGAAPSQVTDATPRAGCLFFLLPVGFAVAIFLAYIALFTVGSVGGSAAGARVAMTFETCPEAASLIEARSDQMGLGDPVLEPVEGGLRLTATLPDTPAADTVPETLARGGDLRIRAGESADGEVVVGHDGVEEAELSLKELGNPLVVLTLTREAHRTLEAHMEAHIEGQIGLWIDDEVILVRPNDPPFRRQEIDLRAEGEDGVDNLRRAADWAIVVSHGPLPCPTSLRQVSPVGR
jgi:hypothetical protein